MYFLWSLGLEYFYYICYYICIVLLLSFDSFCSHLPSETALDEEYRVIVDNVETGGSSELEATSFVSPLYTIDVDSLVRVEEVETVDCAKDLRKFVLKRNFKKLCQQHQQ